MKTRIRLAVLLCVTALAGAMPWQASAQSAYPSRSVHLVVPWATGGFNDLLARLLAERMGPALGQPVIVENRPGAAGTLGSEYVARAAPDGYTVLLATADTHAISAAVYPGLRYDPLRDFAPISLLVSQPVALWVASDSAFKDLAGLVAHARANPGKLTYASNGNGSATHLGMESFARAAGIGLLHVPYKGTGPALVDLLGGRLDTMFLSVQAAGAHATSGKLRPLAVSAAERSPALAQVPTFDEAGIPFRLALWQGLMAPRGTPPDAIAKLAQASATALADPELKSRMVTLGVEMIVSDAAAFQQFLASEVTRWRETAKALNVQLE